MKQRMLSAAAAALLMATMATPAGAAPSNVEQAQGELDQIEADFTSLANSYEDLKENNELTQAKLEELQALTDDQEAVYEAKKDKLSGYVASSYKAGTTSLLEIVLNSSSFEDLCSNVYYANRIRQESVDALNEVKAAKAVLDEQIAGLSQTKEELSQSLADSEAAKAALSAKLDEQRSYVDSLSDEVKAQVVVADLDEEAVASTRTEEQQTEVGTSSANAAEGDAQTETTTSEEASQTSEPQTSSEATSTQETVTQQENTSSSTDKADTKNTSTKGTQSTTSDNSLGERVVELAMTQLGVPYKVYATQWNVEMDCSGFTYLCYKYAGVSIPRSQTVRNGGEDSQAAWVYRKGHWKTSIADLVPGDIVFYGSAWNNTDHVGIYIGNGMNIEEDSKKVSIREVYDPSWHPTWHNFVGGGSPV